MMYWTLDGHEPVSTDNVLVWGEFFEDSERRRVAQTQVGEAYVSTVFLGIDHNFALTGPPLLFETMIFGGPFGDAQWRYATWDEAAAGHARIVAALEAGLDPSEDVEPVHDELLPY